MRTSGRKSAGRKSAGETRRKRTLSPKKPQKKKNKQKKKRSGQATTAPPPPPTEASSVLSGVAERVEQVVEHDSFSPKRFKRLLRPRTLVLVGLAILLLLLVSFGLRLYATLSEDLVLTLNPKSAYVSVVHGEEATIPFSLRTNNYLFCEASCTAVLVDRSAGLVVDERDGIRLQDSNESLSFTVRAPEQGEGERLYQLRVSCANVERPLCRRAGALHEAVALVTMQYSLSPAEAAVRDDALITLPYFVSLVHDGDASFLAAKAYYDSLDVAAESLGGLAPPNALVSEHASLLSRAYTLQSLWNNESYTSLGEVPTTRAARFLQNISSWRSSLESYVTAQHELVDELSSLLDEWSLLERAARLFTLSNATLSFGEASSLASGLQRLSSRVAAYPVDDVLSRLVQARALRVSRDVLVGEARSLLDERLSALSVALTAEFSRWNESLPVVSTGNDSSFDSAWSLLTGRCLLLENVSSRCSLENESLANASTSLLSDCRFLLGNASVVSPPVVNSAAFVSFSPVVVNASSSVENSLLFHQPECCLDGACAACAVTGSLPVLFLHGHSMVERNAPEFSLEAFNDYKRLFEEEGLFLDAGLLTPYDSFVDMPEGVWSHTVLPVMVTGTYYYDAYLQGSSYILSRAKSESLDTYAIRVKDLVAELRSRTGAEKVVIVTHSMGALVARRYVQLFAGEGVRAIIMIAPPSTGVNASVAFLCPFFGADQECAEMRSGSAFLAKLNDPHLQSGVPLYVVAGTGCPMGDSVGDGVVFLSHALANASDVVDSVVVNGSCLGAEVLHTKLLDPVAYPTAFSAVREWLLLLR